MSAREVRSIRLTVPAETYAAVEEYAKARGESIAKSAAYVLSLGVAIVEAVVEQDME